MDETTLRVFDAAGGTVFETGGKWLHPLFALEDFLAEKKLDASALTLEDKIIGLGAAFLVIRMGFRRCRAKLLSGRAAPLLEKYGVAYEWDERVEKIGCRTEDLFSLETPLDDAHAELSRRAGRSA